MPFTPPLDELHDLWKFSYASAAMVEAREALKLLQVPNLGREAVRAFSTAFLVAYARPFTPSQITAQVRARVLADFSPPAHLASIHAELIEIRNKVIGHKDATIAPGRDATPNIVLLAINHPEITVSVADVLLSPDSFPALDELVAHYLSISDSRVVGFIRRHYGHLLARPNGIYRLSMTFDGKLWLEDDSAVGGRRDGTK